MAQITSSAGPIIEPDLVFAYEASSDSLNVFHRILGRTDPDVSLDGDSLLEGSLELFFLEESSAQAARLVLREPARFTLVDVDRPTIGMTFVREGRMRIRQDRDTLTRWILEVGFREVLA